MNETVTQELETTTPAVEAGMPVDITMDEYVAFQLLFAKKFGRLKMQTPGLILFGIFMLYFLVMMGRLWLETSEFPWAMVIICLMFAASMAVTMVMLPRSVKKTAEKNYRVCERNGYYGEWTIDATQITKNSGESVDTSPLNERTMYIETADCMVFMTQGEAKAIMLPARCMTEEAAKKVRDIVFDPACRVQRRVIARMTAKADKPIERRELFKESPTIYTVDVVYEEHELKKLCVDQAWQRFASGLMMSLPIALFLGAAMAMGFDNVLAGLITIPAVMLLNLLTMLSSASRRVKKIRSVGFQRLIVTMSEQCIHFRQPPGAPIAVAWKHVDRAVETPDGVEFYYGGNLMRIPKRAIGDMEEFRCIVDGCMKK